MGFAKAMSIIFKNYDAK